MMAPWFLVMTLAIGCGADSRRVDVVGEDAGRLRGALDAGPLGAETGVIGAPDAGAPADAVAILDCSGQIDGNRACAALPDATPGACGRENEPCCAGVCVGSLRCASSPTAGGPLCVYPCAGVPPEYCPYCGGAGQACCGAQRWCIGGLSCTWMQGTGAETCR